MRKDLTAPGVAARLKSDRAVAIARRLRKEMTPAEKQLWYALKRLPLERSHFRRQVVLGPFIADFVCHGARLVVELEGGAHRVPDVAARDAERAAWIEGRGYAVMRIANERVKADPARVAHEIWCEARMRLEFVTSSPLAGEGRVGGASADL